MESKTLKPVTKSVKERVRLLRERRLQEGMTELRGIFVPTLLHAEAKLVLAKWLKSRGK